MWAQAWAERDRLALDQMADHLETQAASTDDESRPELGERHTGLRELHPDLLARSQEGRTRGIRVAQSPQVDDTLHSGFLRRPAKVTRTDKVSVVIAS